MAEKKKKSFWKRPEGITGAVFLAGTIIGGVVLINAFLAAIVSFFSGTIGMIVGIVLLLMMVWTAVDPKARALVSYMFKSSMRWITGIFIKMDPIGILKSYVDDLRTNLRKMNRQISQLRVQMHTLKELMVNNQKQIANNLTEAGAAKKENRTNVVILKTRKASRLKNSNMKLDKLYQKMEVLYRVLNKMYENSEIMLEDIEDQVQVKEQERKAILASHNAMGTAMKILKGDKDKKEMFDRALEAVADDVSQKVGEMERFMQVSEGFMQSLDLQNGVFEEEGLKMLEQWEKEGTSLLLGEEKLNILEDAADDDNILDLNEIPQREKMENRDNQYDTFFE